jgi:acetyl-CoA synthetase
MRRLLRDIAENRDLGDVTTLLDPSVTDAIRDRMSTGTGGGEEG